MALGVCTSSVSLLPIESGRDTNEIQECFSIRRSTNTDDRKMNVCLLNPETQTHSASSVNHVSHDTASQGSQFDWDALWNCEVLWRPPTLSLKCPFSVTIASSALSPHTNRLSLHVISHFMRQALRP